MIRLTPLILIPPTINPRCNLVSWCYWYPHQRTHVRNCRYELLPICLTTTLQTPKIIRLAPQQRRLSVRRLHSPRRKGPVQYCCSLRHLQYGRSHFIPQHRLNARNYCSCCQQTYVWRRHYLRSQLSFRHHWSSHRRSSVQYRRSKRRGLYFWRRCNTNRKL